nr:HAD family hydrolase [Mycoplasmopsis columbinasalis]
MDGTILPYAHLDFSDNTIKMFELLSQKGIKSVINSAREFVTIGSLLNLVPAANYFIGANGMFVYDIKNKKIIYENPIKLADLETIYNEVKDLPQLEGFMVTDLNFLYHSPGINKGSWFLSSHKAKMRLMDFEAIDENHIHIITLQTYGPETTAQLETIINKIIEKHKMPLYVNSKWHKGLFITPTGVTKYSALEWLAKKLGYEANKNLIAFGDSSNDYEMIEHSAYGVSVGTYDEKLVALADDIALKVEQDGAYWKLKELEII